MGSMGGKVGAHLYESVSICGSAFDLERPGLSLVDDRISSFSTTE
jgi:hypothetical protein